MYKKLSYNNLFEVKTWFITNLKKLYTNKRYTYLKEFLKDISKEWNIVYFFESNQPVFKITKQSNWFCLSDEKEKIQVELSEDEINKLHSQLKNDKQIKKSMKENKTITQRLFDEFREKKFETIEWKPYLVYDIETVWDINNLQTMKFMLWYSIISNENHIKTMKYRPVEEDAIKRFVEYMLNFDWWIIWYNNIHFDNPVSIYNANMWESEIDILNNKSIDLFQFIRNLTWKRIWLDKVSQNLISVWKTLESWQEWEKYLKQYMQNKDQEAYKKVKSYCKNDVKMTLGVLLYFLKHNYIHIWEKDFEYDIKKFVELANQQKSTKNKEVIDSLF